MSEQRTRAPFFRRAPGRGVLAGVVAVFGCVAPLSAQSLLDEVELRDCPEGQITSIWVDNHSVFDLTQTGHDRRFGWAFRAANRLHVRTREEVIRRELVFEPGDCYDPERLRESERVLRATGFIADVDIFGVPQPDGSIHVVVETRDDWSTRVEVGSESGTGFRVNGVALRETNLLGTGRQAALFYVESRHEKVYGGSYMDPQLFGSRWQGGLALGRTAVGTLYRQSLSYPFIGETGRRAFRHGLEHNDRFFRYHAMDGSGLVGILVPESRRAFDVGGAIRLGEPGHLTLLGALVSGERVWYPGSAELQRDRSPAPDSLVDPILARLDSVADVRASILVGQRNVYYVRRRALDTVNATEDVRLGLEIELGMGRSITAVSTHDDMSLDVGLFAAGRLGENVLVGTRMLVEGKRDYDSSPDEPEWRDVFGQFDFWSYWRPRESRHTVVGAIGVTGGWHARIPFQLTLGGATGLRGHPLHVAPGGTRLVGTLEARSHFAWPIPELFDFGTTVFVDAGRTWAGQVPFGVDSPVYSSMGVGVRGAFPPGSQSTLRMDVAAPIRGGLAPADLVISMGLGHAIGQRPRMDMEMYRTSRRGIGASRFQVRSERGR
jgi:hypothetical protein